MTISFKTFLLSIGILFSASAMGDDIQALSCDLTPGKELCKELRVFRSYLVGCNGDACTSLWNKQIRHMNGLTDHYYSEFPEGVPVAMNLATSAQKTAYKLCTYKLTGDVGLLNRFMVSANRFLVAMKELQEASEIDPVGYCQFSVSGDRVLAE